MNNNNQELGEKASAISWRRVLLHVFCVGVLVLPVTTCGVNPNSDALLHQSDQATEKKKTKMKPNAKIAVAERFYNEGRFGSAEQAYRSVIEANPRNAEAWLGIAATYDNLKRFPNANRAYMMAVKLKGFTPEILNNLGYHYILRGDYEKARKALSAANKKKPGNKYILNNLKLLEEHEATSKKPSLEPASKSS